MVDPRLVRPLIAVCAQMVILLACSKAPADQIDPREVNLALQSITTDYELAMLGAMHGVDASAIYLYGVDIGPGDWQGTMEGTHLGQDIFVAFSGQVTPTSATTADISFQSTGTWGDTPWSTEGTWHYEDPDLTGFAFGRDMKFSIGGKVGYFDIDLELKKDVFAEKLSASITAGVGKLPAGIFGDFSIASGTGTFSLDQRTGKDESSVSISLIGVELYTKTLNTTQLFIPPPNPPPRPPKPPKPPVIPQPPYYPEYPPGSIPGIINSPPGQRIYDYGYAQSITVPESRSLALFGLGVLCIVLSRRPRSATMAHLAQKSGGGPSPGVRQMGSQ